MVSHARIAKSASSLQSAIRLFQLTDLEVATVDLLASQVVDHSFPRRTDIMIEGKKTQAALYLVRYGKVEMTSSDGEHSNIIDEGGYFGEDMLEMDVGGQKQENDCLAKYSVCTLGQDVVLGVLTLQQCREIIDTTILGLGKRRTSQPEIAEKIQLEDLQKHAILGAGTFGQVWLVSHQSSTGIRRPYALKIQSKYELIMDQQAKGVVREKNIMQQLHHPFLINLVQTYQDDQRVYMLVGLVQGGELFGLLHQATHDGIPENDSKFYAAGIIEGLSFMHRRHILYRDLKPENVLIDKYGYPVIVDLGFGTLTECFHEHIHGRIMLTSFPLFCSQVCNRLHIYTVRCHLLLFRFGIFLSLTQMSLVASHSCGTPLYLAPEVILNRGHDKGADHWSYAVLLYEMIAGYTPFYTDGMDQMTLFRSICNGVYTFPSSGIMSMEIEDLLQRFFVVDSAKRLGSLARGINEIYAHKWFSDIDFAELRRKEIEAPWVPEINDPLDKSNFENWDHLDDRTLKKDPPILPLEQEIFHNF